MSETKSLKPLPVIKEASQLEEIMCFIKKQDLLTYCVCDFMLSTGCDLKNTLLLTYEQLYMIYQDRLVPVSNLYTGSRLIYFDKECGLYTALNEELTRYIMQSYSGVMSDYVFYKSGSRQKAVNRSFMARKIGGMLNKLGYEATASLFKTTFGYFYMCRYHTLIGTPFSYLCYRKEQLIKTFSLTENEYRQIEETGFSLEENYRVSVVANKMHIAHSHIRNNTDKATAAAAFLEELSLLTDTYDF